MKSISDLLPTYMHLASMPARAYKPMLYDLGYITEGLAPCVAAAHRAVQWWLNDILHRHTGGRRWLTLYGRSGCGKSHLLEAAAAHLRAALPQRTVQRWAWGSLLDKLLDGEHEGLMAQVQQMPVLLLDDVGSELMASERAQSVAMRNLYVLLEARLGKWTLLTSNLAPADIPDGRIASRLFRGLNELVDMSAADDFCFLRHKSTRPAP